MVNQIVVIAAVDKDGGIAKDNKIPWRYPDDFRWFKSKTHGHACIMGRKTYEEINELIGDKGVESVLPDRKCFVLSNSLETLPNAHIVKSFDEALLKMDSSENQILFAIGGYNVFVEGLKRADVAVISIINDEHECNHHFPTWDLMKMYHPAGVQRSGDDKLIFTEWRRKR